MSTLLSLPTPELINGGELEAEVAAALAVFVNDVSVTVDPAGEGALLVAVPDGVEEATVAVTVAAHDPEVLTTQPPRSWPADGATPAVVRWQHRGSAGTDVPYDVNGTAGAAAADAAGVVELAVTAATPGPVRVRVGTLEVELMAEEV